MNNGYPPFSYEMINGATSLLMPSTVHVSKTGVCNYFKKYFLQMTMSVFKWNLPKNWNSNYFLYVLYCWGYIGVINTDRFGVVPQQCGLQGYNVMYNPTKIVVSNPLIKGIRTPVIDRQCTVIKMQQDYTPILDIIEFYAMLSALAVETASINMLNSRLSYIYAAGEKTVAESFKKMFDKIASGDPMVVVDKNMFNENGDLMGTLLEQNVRQNYIAGDVLQDLRRIENMFCTMIGIKNSNTDKKERQIVDEVNANNEETKSLAAIWLEELQSGCEKTRNLFGIDISVDWRFKEEGVTDGVGSYTINNGSI